MIKFIFGILAGLYLAQNFNITFDDVVLLIENFRSIVKSSNTEMTLIIFGNFI